MKCDRRWWNDGRLEAEREAWSNGWTAAEDESKVVAEWCDSASDGVIVRFRVWCTRPVYNAVFRIDTETGG